eukprot:jgi/Pico_ML_1/54531/g4865.t1
MERVETRKARAFEDDGARETVHGWMGRPVELRHDKARDASASDATTVGTHRAQVLGDSTTTEAWKRAHPIARQLCEMDGRARSWRKKLEALRESLKDNLHRKATDPSHPPGMVQGQADEDDRTLRTTTEPDPNRIEAICRGEEEDLEAMACANLYLSWMARGRVPCEDADGHYRPNHHARISKELFVMVEGVEARARARARARMPSTGREAHPTHDAGLEGALARRVSARLPAFDARFTHAEPLTRIRDIAHGKGRTDAAIGAKMLSKLTAEDADYPQAFVDEFRTFYRELKDFFGASGLRDVLDALGPVLDEEGIRRLDSLREALEHSVHERGKDGPSPDGDGGTDPAPEEGERQPDASGFVHALDVARLSLELRRHVLDAISDRAPVLEDEEADAKGTSCTTRYAMRMADARLEELAFVKLSAVASFLEAARERLLDRTDPSNDGGGNDETDALETPGWSDLVCLEIQALMALFQRARSLSTRHADQLEKVLVPRAESLAVGLKNADSAALLAEAARVHETEGDGEVSLRETSETSNDPDGSPEGPIEAARERSTDAGSSTEAAVDGDIGDVPTDLRVRPMEKETDPVAVHRLAGAKAGHCFTLQRLSRGNGDAGSRIVFRVPRSFFLPQGSMELLLTETESDVGAPGGGVRGRDRVDGAQQRV